jgi:hypothetical protein
MGETGRSENPERETSREKPSFFQRAVDLMGNTLNPFRGERREAQQDTSQRLSATSNEEPSGEDVQNVPVQQPPVVEAQQDGVAQPEVQLEVQPDGEAQVQQSGDEPEAQPEAQPGDQPEGQAQSGNEPEAQPENGEAQQPEEARDIRQEKVQEVIIKFDSGLSELDLDFPYNKILTLNKEISFVTQGNIDILAGIIKEAMEKAGENVGLKDSLLKIVESQMGAGEDSLSEVLKAAAPYAYAEILLKDMENEFRKEYPGIEQLGEELGKHTVTIDGKFENGKFEATMKIPIVLQQKYEPIKVVQNKAEEERKNQARINEEQSQLDGQAAALLNHPILGGILKLFGKNQADIAKMLKEGGWALGFLAGMFGVQGFREGYESTVNFLPERFQKPIRDIERKGNEQLAKYLREQAKVMKGEELAKTLIDNESEGYTVEEPKGINLETACTLSEGQKFYVKIDEYKEMRFADPINGGLIKKVDGGNMEGNIGVLNAGEYIIDLQELPKNTYIPGRTILGVASSMQGGGEEEEVVKNPQQPASEGQSDVNANKPADDEPAANAGQPDVAKEEEVNDPAGADDAMADDAVQLVDEQPEEQSEEESLEVFLDKYLDSIETPNLSDEIRTFLIDTMKSAIGKINSDNNQILVDSGVLSSDYLESQSESIIINAQIAYLFQEALIALINKYPDEAEKFYDDFKKIIDDFYPALKRIGVENPREVIYPEGLFTFDQFKEKAEQRVEKPEPVVAEELPAGDGSPVELETMTDGKVLSPKEEETIEGFGRPIANFLEGLGASVPDDWKDRMREDYLRRKEDLGKPSSIDDDELLTI